ncbi:MAG: hypothetical protein GXP25_20115 [Planctomycetes bacterium]|nr:hypothetical protein [Planctomycetota bacterium]
MLKRCVLLFLFVGGSATLAPGQWNGRHSLSRPEKDHVWGITRNGTSYRVIPYDLIDRLSHKKLRKMIGGITPGSGYIFFVVAIDNTKGKEPVEFSAFSASVTFHCVWPMAEDAARYDVVDLRNYFADPDNSPENKEAYEKVKAMFKTHLTVPPGKTGWSLIAIRDTFSFEHCKKAAWAFPGGPPKKLSKQKFSPATLKKCHVEVFPWDTDL